MRDFRPAVIAAIAAVVCVLAVALAVATASRAAGAMAATVQVGGPAAVAPTSTTQGFLGLATSLSTIPGLSGSATDPDVPFDNLVKSLSPGAPPLLRLGGNSADNSWWPVPGVTGGQEKYLYTLTSKWGARVHAMLARLNAKALIGLNLELGPKVDAEVVKTEVTDFDRYVGAKQIYAFELGNEPEFFPLAVVTGQRGVRGHTTIAAYGKKFSGIAAQLGGAPLAGPGSVGPVWLHSLATILRDLPARLKLATMHAYALKNCSSLARLSLSDLFTPASLQGLAASIHQAVEAAASRGKPLRVDEMGGVTCGGKAGLSNSFGEALWALNLLPALWQAGIQGVNFQSVDGGSNQVITAKHSGSDWRVTVEPEFYGLLAFAQSAPAGSRLLRISRPGLADFYQFAVRAPDGSERVVLTNVGATARTVGVSATGAHGAGSVSRLTAKSLRATGGVTLGGQHLAAHTGQLTGTPRQQSVSPNAKGMYAVKVPPHTAAILTLAD